MAIQNQFLITKTKNQNITFVTDLTVKLLHSQLRTNIDILRGMSLELLTGSSRRIVNLNFTQKFAQSNDEYQKLPRGFEVGSVFVSETWDPLRRRFKSALGYVYIQRTAP